MKTSDWLNDLKGDDSMRQASQASGFAQTTLQRQVDKGQFSPEMVIALCRAYGRSPVQGLIETGYIHAHEVDSPAVAVALEKATNAELLAEINRRSDPEARYLFTADLDPEVVDIQEDAEVFHIAPTDGTVVDFDSTYGSHEYAADSSSDEQAERERRGEDMID
ncbi:hypothetical protein [Corynebacterium phocae]|uniref:hypothetical protein n=1 Tax=Corynebacterium phocae TaxID=161895 RepID=UPI000951C98A|nr:hypothetical protein [Corynebacterium phocae]KAA8723257.1 hypothetical protein F4V58_08045 [Corynebacterium phocae]